MFGIFFFNSLFLQNILRYSAIQTGQNVGMQTLDQCLTEMVRRNMVNVIEARQRAVNKELFA